MASKSISQKDYLKKYLSGPRKHKKEKKKKSREARNLKIIDDNEVNLNQAEVDEELLLGGDDAPVIVAEYVEDPKNIKRKWRSIAVKDEPVEEPDKPSLKHSQPIEGVTECIKAIKQEPRDSPERPEIKSRKANGIEQCQVREIKREPRSPSSLLSQPQTDPLGSRKYKTDASSHNKHSAYSPDQSPPRKSKNRRSLSLEQSLARNRKHRDISIRRERSSRSSDLSPPRKRKTQPSSSVRSADQSPPRRNKSRRSLSSDQSPPRKRKNQDTYIKTERLSISSDLSPPRKRKNRDISIKRERSSRSSDLSPPRQHKEDSGSRNKCRVRSPDLSPPRRRKNRHSVSPIQSPKRKQRDYNGSRKTESSSRSSNKDYDHRKRQSPNSKRRNEPSSRRKSRTHSPDKPKQLTSLKREDSIKSPKQSSKVMSFDPKHYDDEVKVRKTGRRGQRAREAAEEDPEKRQQREAAEKKIREKYERWGKGLKQIEERDMRFAEMAHEAAKPVARYANDEDLDRFLREKEHPDDPMLEYMRAKRRTEKNPENATAAAPSYKGPYPENRYGMRPGHRWDGVDRSNGYEKRWFKVRSDRVAMQEEAYKYSVADM